MESAVDRSAEQPLAFAEGALQGHVVRHISLDERHARLTELFGVLQSWLSAPENQNLCAVAGDELVHHRTPDAAQTAGHQVAAMPLDGVARVRGTHDVDGRQ